MVVPSAPPSTITARWDEGIVEGGFRT